MNPTIIGENSTGSEELVASTESEEDEVAPIQVMVTAQEDSQPTSADQNETEAADEVVVEDQGTVEDAST